MIHTHEQALDALCGCAATVSVLSYQEAIEGYFKLRGLPIPPDQAALNPADTALKAAVERVTAMSVRLPIEMQDGLSKDDACHKHAADLRTLLAALSDANVEIIGLRADVEAAHAIGRQMIVARDAALSSQAEVMEAMAKGLEPFSNFARDADLWPDSEGSIAEVITGGLRHEILWAHLRDARTALSQYRTLTGVSHD